MNFWSKNWISFFLSKYEYFSSYDFAIGLFLYPVPPVCLFFQLIYTPFHLFILFFFSYRKDFELESVARHSLGYANELVWIGSLHKYANCGHTLSQWRQTDPKSPTDHKPLAWPCEGERFAHSNQNVKNWHVATERKERIIILTI